MISQIKRELFDLVHRLPSSDSALISAMTITMVHASRKSASDNRLWGKIINHIPEEAYEHLGYEWRYNVAKCPVCGMTPNWWMYDWKTDPSVPHRLAEYGPDPEPERKKFYGLTCGQIRVDHDTFDVAALAEKWANAVKKFEHEIPPLVLRYCRGMAIWSGLLTTHSYRDSCGNLPEKVEHCLQIFTEKQAVQEAGGETVEALMGTGTFGLEDRCLHLSWGTRPAVRGATIKVDIAEVGEKLHVKCRVIGLKAVFDDCEVRHFLRSILRPQDEDRIEKIEWDIDPRECMLKDFFQGKKS